MYVAARNGGRRTVRNTVGTVTLHVLIVEDDEDFVDELRETIDTLPGDSTSASPAVGSRPMRCWMTDFSTW